MKTLWLLRHAKSSWADPGREDIDRPLNRRGIEQCALLGRYLASRRVIPELVLCSPAKRARETVELLALNLDRSLRTEIRPAIYLGGPERILEAIRGADDNVASLLVVGHNPDFAALARSLGHDGAREKRERLAASKFPTAALAGYEADVRSWKSLGQRATRLVAFVTPKLLS